MSVLMAKEKKPAGDQPKKPNRTDTEAIQFYTTPELANALRRFVTDQPEDARPRMRAVIEAALKQYLRGKGYWPTLPPQPGE